MMDSINLTISPEHWHALPVDIQEALRPFAVTPTRFQMSVYRYREIVGMVQGSPDHHVRRILEGTYEPTTN